MPLKHDGDLNLFRIGKQFATMICIIIYLVEVVSPQHFLTYEIGPRDLSFGIFRFTPSSSPKQLRLNQDQPLKEPSLYAQILIK